LPVDARFSPAGLPRVAVVYGLHAALGIAILILSATRTGGAHADRLALGLVLGAILNTFVYLALWPRNPMLIATSLVCVLMGTVFFFSWGTRRTVFVSLFTVVGFVVVGAAARPPDVEPGALVSAASALGVGAVITVAVARLL